MTLTFSRDLDGVKMNDLLFSSGMPHDGVCRVDDTSPERAVTGLSPG